MEVNGVAGQVSFGPAPIRVFDDQTGIAGQNQIFRLAWVELESRCRSGASGANLAARICSRVQRRPRPVGLREWVVTVFSPVGLDEDAVDLLEVHDGVWSRTPSMSELSEPESAGGTICYPTTGGVSVTNAPCASLYGLPVGPVSLSTTPVPLRKVRARHERHWHCAA